MSDDSESVLTEQTIDQDCLQYLCIEDDDQETKSIKSVNGPQYIKQLEKKDSSMGDKTHLYRACSQRKISIVTTKNNNKALDLE